MKIIMKVLTVLKVFVILCLFASISFATDPGAPSTGVGGTSGSGPLGSSGSNVCGTSSIDPIVLVVALTFIFGGAIVVGIMILLTGKIKENLPEQNEPASKETPCYSTPGSESIPTIGGEARVQQPDGTSSMARLNVGSNGVGRDSGNAIVLDDPKASRNHADIHLSNDGRYTLTDMGSQNGTFVNGSRVTQQELYQGDQILIGDSKIIV